jgi:hypothetical protein
MTEQNDKKHEKIAKRAEDISMTATIVSAAVGVGANFFEPTGFSAIGVMLGIIDEPFIVTAVPMVSNVATVTGVISGCAYFYSKWKNKRENRVSV